MSKEYRHPELNPTGDRRILRGEHIIFLDSRFKAKNKWISEWIREELEIIPDKPNALIQVLNPFWNVK